MADWVGTYQDPVRLGTVTIAKVGSGYSATWKGATRALSLDYGDTAFWPDPTYGELSASFWHGANGKVEWLRTTEGHAKKID